MYLLQLMVILTEFCNVQGLENGEKGCHFSTYRAESYG